MSSFDAFGSRWISLADHCRSSFALDVFILCVGEHLPSSSGDADEGCQWEIQTNEGWVPYWDSQVLVIRGGLLTSRAKRVCLS
jgi:hypothetical protein